jgi:hypothetical protein
MRSGPLSPTTKVPDDESHDNEQMSTDEQTPIDQETFTDEQMWSMFEQRYRNFDKGPQIDLTSDQSKSGTGPFRLWNRILRVEEYEEEGWSTGTMV